MKTKRQSFYNSYGITLIALLTLLLTYNCKPHNKDLNQTIREHIENIKVIGTHEHQLDPSKHGIKTISFFEQLKSSYLYDDLISAGASRNSTAEKNLDSDSLWNYYEPFLNSTRTTSYYRQLIKGYQKLYDFEGPYFTKDNVSKLNEQLVENYNNYDSWFNKAFELSGFDLMLVDQYWNPYELERNTGQFALASQVNQMIVAPLFKEKVPPEYSWIHTDYWKMAKSHNFSMQTLEEYLTFSNFVFENYFAKNSVCLKNSQGYDRSLYFEEVSFEEAAELYLKEPSTHTESEKKKLMDFMFHWIIQKAIQYDIPIQIHTGYLAGTGRVLENSRPSLLNNLFIKYPKAKFILFHGGYPYTSEWIALGKMFPNVYLDFSWLPQISQMVAKRVLEECLDTVPYNKILWGGDEVYIEGSVGALELTKEVIAEVLIARVKRGSLTVDMALLIADHIFRNNAILLLDLEYNLTE
ncbi:amidohydrolase family protein [Ulvibacterium marinum]|uniref:Amidohydrolase-related domain-containing protein n=1 Tax=Ulvibacterium marinum TaxID=2419782 RepID=A0A3B0C0G3_9FLAO|nr:amidohydrolase family protein [Ulvibacterium marinum]RKN79265.1 hypothetical protein D7Z94_13130 [Ulvibacterium marinum]